MNEFHFDPSPLPWGTYSNTFAAAPLLPALTVERFFAMSRRITREMNAAAARSLVVQVTRLIDQDEAYQLRNTWSGDVLLLGLRIARRLRRRFAREGTRGRREAQRVHFRSIAETAVGEHNAKRL